MLSTIVHPIISLAIFAMAHLKSRALNVWFFFVPDMFSISVHRKYVWDCTNVKCKYVPQLHALHWHWRWVMRLRLPSPLQ